MEYGTSYFGVRDVSHASDDLDRFRDGGLNAVLHTFSERDQLYSVDHIDGLTVWSNRR